MKDIFPKDFLSGTTEVHPFMPGKKSQINYGGVVIQIR